MGIEIRMKIEYPIGIGMRMRMDIINEDGDGGYEIQSKSDRFSSLSVIFRINQIIKFGYLNYQKKKKSITMHFLLMHVIQGRSTMYLVFFHHLVFIYLVDCICTSNFVNMSCTYLTIYKL